MRNTKHSLPRLVFIAGLSMLAVSACGDSAPSSGALELLQSDCVHENITSLDRVLADGASCDNFGYSDCARGSSGSDCINYCAFDKCQAQSCTSFDDCRGLGTDYDCQEYVVSDTSYGMWCGVSDCPRGTIGCACLDGQCGAPTGFTVSCEGDVCVGQDTCPTGCRAGSVCCGGAFCAGDCIGTPCC